MPLLVMSSMGLSFVAVVALFGRIGINRDRKRRRLAWIAGKAGRTIDEELEAPFVKRFLLPTAQAMVKSFSRLLPRKRRVETTGLERDLMLAGMRTTVSEYVAARMIYVLITLGATIGAALFIDASVGMKALVYLGGITLALCGPRLYLSRRIKRRRLGITHQLPEILDLLTVSVEAGLSFDGGLMYIEQYHHGALVDELGIVKKEIHMGIPRREALKKLAERNDVAELKSFAGAMIQSDQIGLPVRNVLRMQASQLRQSRKQAAEEKAMKAPIKMMLPLVAFILPVIFIILLGPTVLNLIKTFGG